MKEPPDSEKPACFANIDIVFPRGEDGLRHSPESCMPCCYKTQCLRMAMQGTGGIAAKEEQTDRAYESGLIGFFERWSRKKELNRQRRDRKKNR